MNLWGYFLNFAGVFENLFVDMKVVFATQNKGKLREASDILGEGVELLTPQECGIDGEAEETGTTFAENSFLKAKYIWDRIFGDMRQIENGGDMASPRNTEWAISGKVDAVFADDSGLEVDALGGEPGIYTARYAGNDKNFADNMDKLLFKLKQAGADTPEARKARFRCVVTLIFSDGRTFVSDGSLEGQIAFHKAGCGGFGYDPVFIPDDGELSALASSGLAEQEIAALRGKTLAEIPEHLKNLISHRFKALRAVVAALQEAEKRDKTAGK